GPSTCTCCMREYWAGTICDRIDCIEAPGICARAFLPTIRGYPDRAGCAASCSQLSASTESSGSHSAQDEAARHVFPSPRHPAADARVSDLAASGCAIVGVLPFAPSRTGVVDPMAQLARVLDHHLDAVSVALRQMSAGQIARQFVIDLEPPAFYKFSCLARSAKAVGLELNEGGERERVVTGNEVDIAMRNTGHPECAFPSVVPGDVVQHRPRVVPLWILGHGSRVAAEDEHRRMTEIIRPLA